jgi:tRNA U55 pseudouridine synthase TruB
LGRKLGCPSHLASLRRTRSGEFTEDNAVALSKLSMEHLIPMEELLAWLPRIDVSDHEEQRVVHGNDIPVVACGHLARIFNKRGEFLAIASVENGWARPRLVLTSVTSN